MANPRRLDQPRVPGRITLPRVNQEAFGKWAEAIGSIVDTDLEPLPVDAALLYVTRRLATYNLLALPVVDSERRLLGAVSVDDVLDHLLPEDWRDNDGGDSSHSANSSGASGNGASGSNGASGNGRAALNDGNRRG